MIMQQTRTCDKCSGTITAEEIIRRRAGLVEGRLLCSNCVDELRRQVAAARAAQKARAALSAETSEKAEKVEGAVASGAEESEETKAAAVATAEAAESHGDAATAMAGGNGATDDVDGDFEGTTQLVPEEGPTEAVEGAAASQERAALMEGEREVGEEREPEREVETAVEERPAESAEWGVETAVEERPTESAEREEAAAAEPISAVAAAAEPVSAVAAPAHHEIGEDVPRCLILHGPPTEQGVVELQERINEWLASHPELSVKATSTTVGAFAGIPGEQRILVTVFFDVNPHFNRR